MADPVTPNPTWEYPIRQFFNEIDVNHMLQISRGSLDLGSYENVRKNVERIWRRVENKSMPIPPSEPWSDEMIATYKIWKDRGCPQS